MRGTPWDDPDVPPTERTVLVREALRALDKERFVFNLHDASFPSASDGDIGRGSPYSRAGRRLLDATRALGFDSILLGPQGLTSASNRSPYDGTFFSRSPLSIDLEALVETGLLRAETFEQLKPARSSGRARVKYGHAYAAMEHALDEAFATFRENPARFSSLAGAIDRFATSESHWLERDALFHALGRVHGTDDYSQWPTDDAHAFMQPRATDALRRAHAAAIERYAFAQYLVHAQHAAWKREAARDMVLYGDLQVGASLADRWGHPGVFLRDYVMGAPPSRTTMAGQPWGYGVLDPFALAPGDIADRFLRMRLAKVLGEYDGLRVDHPHGIVCPWVYRVDDPDPASAVRRGARLFESPDLVDHPALARYARVSPAQIDHSRTRWDDHWVSALTGNQVNAYAAQIDCVLDEATRRGRAHRDLLFEVLSTCPAPLDAVLSRHQAGRFRVTQKANLADPRDVYRSENAAPNDWMMVGTHDTEPLALVVRRWVTNAEIDARAAYLAERLAPSDEARPQLRSRIAADPRMCAQAMLADLFASPARHVMVFFADLFGLDEVFNVPGEVNATNWTLRVPPDWERALADDNEDSRVLDIPHALALALRARGGQHEALATRLDAHARRR